MSIVLINLFLPRSAKAPGSSRCAPIIPVAPRCMGADGFVVAGLHVQIIVVVDHLVLLAIFTWLVTRTRLGRAMRACEQDQTMAALLGIDIDRTICLTFVIGAAWLRSRA